LHAPPAHAAPITWEYTGTVVQSFLPDFTVGTPYTLSWTHDSVQTNLCDGFPGANPRAGWYPGQTVDWRINGLDFIGTGFLLVNTIAPSACTPLFPDTDLELQLLNWSGPTLPISGLPIFPMFQLGHGLFNASWFTGQQPPGVFPITPPTNLTFVGPDFEDSHSVLGSAFFTPEPLDTPEPSSLILLGSGLAIWRLRASRKRGAE